MAHKKGQGSTRNGRDSNAQYRGVKLFSKVEGVVRFETRNNRKLISVYPTEQAEAAK